jgi:hypothetical protein
MIQMQVGRHFNRWLRTADSASKVEKTPPNRGMEAMQVDPGRDQSSAADAGRRRTILIEETAAHVQPIIRDAASSCAARFKKLYEDLPHLDLEPPFEIVLVEEPASSDMAILATSFIYLIEPGYSIENRLVRWDCNCKENDPTGRLRIKIKNDRMRTIFIDIEPEVGSLHPSLTYTAFPNISKLAVHIPTLPLNSESLFLDLDWSIVSYVHFAMMCNPFQTARHREVPCVPFAEVLPELRPIAVRPPFRHQAGRLKGGSDGTPSRSGDA